MPMRERRPEPIAHHGDRIGRVARAAGIPRIHRLLATLALSAACATPLQAQHRVPDGWEEGLFDVAATGLPQSSVAVLVTPRGKFLLPVQPILDPLAVPYRVAADSGVLRVTRPAGVGTASLWWLGAPRLEVTSLAPLDS